MDYKEKLEEAKRLYETANADQKYLLESLFPELKSKAYERIRENCIHFLKLQKSHHASTVEIDECIDWLEKQCEQRSVETIEPKFKVGDWVVNNNGEPQLFQVTERSWPDSKIKRAEDILGMSINTATLDEQYHLWTISDAKNGDVLATDDWVFIFEKIRSNGKPVCYCHYDVDLGFAINDVDTYISTCSTIKPATKEQYEQLEKALADAGYEFDFEKKELKKVESKFNIYDWVVTDKGDIVQIGAVNNGYYTLYNGMDFSISYVDKCWHRWTIDDAMDGDVLACNKEILLFKSYSVQDHHISLYCWYNGQTDNFHVSTDVKLGQDANILPTTKEQREQLFAKMREAGYEWDSEKKELKRIEQKPAWSEEDEKMVRALMSICDEWATRHSCLPKEDNDIEKIKSWFKSLKDRYTWKPIE